MKDTLKIDPKDLAEHLKLTTERCFYATPLAKWALY